MNISPPVVPAGSPVDPGSGSVVVEDVEDVDDAVVAFDVLVPAESSLVAPSLSPPDDPPVDPGPQVADPSDRSGSPVPHAIAERITIAHALSFIPGPFMSEQGRDSWTIRSPRAIDAEQIHTPGSAARARFSDRHRTRREA
jgi:hypothetical protein